MFETFLIIIMAILAVFGVSEFFHIICYKILKPQNPAKQIHIIFLTEIDAEQQLLSVIEEFRWQGSKFADVLVAFTGGLSNEKKKICKERFRGKNIYLTDNFDFLKYERRSK